MVDRSDRRKKMDSTPMRRSSDVEPSFILAGASSVNIMVLSWGSQCTPWSTSRSLNARSSLLFDSGALVVGLVGVVAVNGPFVVATLALTCLQACSV